MSVGERQRRVAFEGAANFRDLGGYDVGHGRRTRWGRLFRSDSLADLTDADHALLDSLGLYTLIDFRVPLERQRKPNRLPSGASVRTVEIGFLPEGALQMLRQVLRGMLDATGVERETLRHYRNLPTDHRREYIQMFHRIEDAAGRPLLIHCTSGKDRTGFGAAMILFALGASRELVMEDYALTNQYRRGLDILLSRNAAAEVIHMLTAAQPKYLEAAFATIDAEYGSMAAYLERGLGLSAERRRRMREWLTEDRQGQGAALDPAKAEPLQSNP
jgi:protein-tyrosine phosphatase